VSVGDATVEDGDYFGEPVVEAARLCARAAAGQIIATDLVYRLGGSRHSHVFESLGDLELKGISEPVPAFELRWEPAAVEGTIPLPERLRELPATAYVGRQSQHKRCPVASAIRRIISALSGFAAFTSGALAPLEAPRPRPWKGRR